MSKHDEAPKATLNIDRDEKGRFVRGNVGGPGNPYARECAQLREILLSTVTADVMLAVSGALIQQALKGNVAAIRLLFQHTLGKPIANPHPDRVDQDELAAFQANVAPANSLDVLLSIPADPALKLKRTLSPALGDKMLEELSVAIQEQKRQEAEAAARKARRTDSKRGIPDTSTTTSASQAGRVASAPPGSGGAHGGLKPPARSVSKRGIADTSSPVSVPNPSPITATEALRLIDPDMVDQLRSDKRAANTRRP